MDQEPGKLIYISGAGHSGSTLLDIVLGRHPQISSLGEIHRFYLSLHKSEPPHRCDCGRSVMQCEFWIKVINRIRSQRGWDLQKFKTRFITTDPKYLEVGDNGRILLEAGAPKRYALSMERVFSAIAPDLLYRYLPAASRDMRRLREIAINSHDLFDAVRYTAGTPIIVDSTKNPIRLRALYTARPESLLIVYLVRDGRAVTHSRMRRHGVTMSQAAKVWVAEHRKQRIIQSHIPRQNKLFVKYEDFCASPEPVLERICRFSGLDYSNYMLSAPARQRHAIGGNPMRFEDGAASKIALNESWRDALTESDLSAFRRIGGSTNRFFGYDD